MAEDKQNKKREPKVEHKKVSVVDEDHRDAQDGGPRPEMPFGVWWQTSPNANAPVFARSCLWAGIGGVALDVLPVLGCAMIAFGAARIMAHKKTMLSVAAALLAAYVGLVVPFLFGLSDASMVALSAIGVLVSFVVAAFVNHKRANVTTDYLVAALASIAMMGVWMLAAALGGTAPGEAVNEIMSSASSALREAGGLDMQAQLSAMLPLIKLLLPFGFFLLAGANVLGAHFGARLTRPMMPTSMWRLERFDAPTWSVVVLIVAVFLCAIGATSNLVLSAGLSTIAALRFIFLLQGIAVMSWWFGKYRIGCLLRFVVIFLAIDLEASFFVLSILGLVDFFANFRKLNRARNAREKA